MSTQAWQAGKLYQPGSLVRPLTAPPVVQSAPTNPDFEAGASGWGALAAGYLIGEFGFAFSGTWSIKYDDVGTGAVFLNDNAVPVTAGHTITAKAYVNQGPAGSGNARASVRIAWFDGFDVEITPASIGNEIDRGSDGEWMLSQVTGVAPVGAVTARIGGQMSSNGNRIQMDAFSWDYSFANTPDALIFKAVQTNSGFSGESEPTWPTVLGNTVVDNEVTWEAVLTSRVLYEAHPILKTAFVEPNWPNFVGASVLDNSIVWEAVSRRVTDAKCPNSRVVAIAASKIFAADDDIIAFSATVNPLDWSTPNDAGYIPFGLNTYGDEPVAALGLYRSNLVAFNNKAFQMWQVDQDPANMAFLDALPVGSTEPRATTPQANDLLFLNAVGVRNIAIAGASTNLQAGGVGQPVDELIKAKIKEGLYQPISLLYPAAGQTWYIFGPEAFVLTINKTKTASWSRYVFPEAITDYTFDGNDLLLRTAGHKVWLVSEDALGDDEHEFGLRLLEDGFARLLEDGSFLELED